MGIRRGSISTPIIADGLIFNIDAANRASYPAQRTFAIAESGSCYNTLDLTQSGSFISDPQFITQPISASCWGFDGVDDYIDCGNDSSLHNPNFTISLWVYQPSTASSVEIISNGLGAWAAKDYGFNIGRYWSNYRFYIGDGTTSYDSSVTATADTWQHLFMSYDGTDVKTYLNGVLDDTVAVPSINYSNSAQNSFIIGKSANSGLELTGNIANIQLYNRALSATEVLHNYNALKGRFGL